MKDSTDWEVLRGIGQQGSGSEEKQAAFCLAGAVQGELGVEKAAAEQGGAPQARAAGAVPVLQEAAQPRRCSAMLILEKLEENRLHPRVSEKLKNGRRTNVNIHRIMRIVWENGAEKILERRGRNS